MEEARSEEGVGNIYRPEVIRLTEKLNFARKDTRVPHAIVEHRLVGTAAKGCNNVLSQSDSLMKEWSRDR
jgi:hypothetical protein